MSEANVDEIIVNLCDGDPVLALKWARAYLRGFQQGGELNLLQTRSIGLLLDTLDEVAKSWEFPPKREAK